MKAFGQFLWRSLLCLLFVVGVTLLFLACVFGLIKFFLATEAKPDAGLQGLLCALTSFAFFLVAIAMGVAVVYVAGLIVRQDLRLKWLPMLAIAAGVFCYGHLLGTGNSELLTPPPFLKPVFDTFATGADMTSVYCYLYGGAMLLMLIYTNMRISMLMVIPKMVLEIAVLIIPLALCVDFSFNYHKPTLLKLLSYPGMLLGLGLCAVVGGLIPFNFARNVGGYMKPFFWLMFLLSIPVTLLGLALLVGAVGVHGITYFLKDLVYAWLPGVASPITDMMGDLNGFIMSIGLLLMGALWLICTFSVMGQRCPVCRRYAHERVTSIEEVKDFVSAPFTVKEKTLTDVDYHVGGWRSEHYDDNENTYEHVRYTNTKNLECRYCQESMGSRSYSGSYNSQLSSKELGKHTEVHRW